jgi:hypothetical protein
VETKLGKLLTPIPAENKIGDEVLIFVRPEDVAVFRKQPETDENVFSGEIKALIVLGEMVDCQITVCQEVIRA